MASLPEVGLTAVIENLSSFKKGADSIGKSYDNINEGADGVGVSTANASAGISNMGGVASSVAAGGMAALTVGVAAVAAAAAAAIAGIGLLAKAAFDLSSDVEASQKKIQSQLGVTEEEAKKLGNTARDVWANNFAGSVEEAAEALVTVRKQLKGISDGELQDATENAIRLSDAFGIDIAESTNAANVLMKQFGLTQSQAFDFIAKGFQEGLNSSDDFLDSVSEYGNLFGQAGGDAGQFFSLLETGLAGGVLGTDAVGDAFKEFTLRIVDGSDTTEDALNDLLVAIDGTGGEIVALEKDYDKATEALDNNTKALEESEGAFAATEKVVNELEKSLGDARRELDDLSKPNLAGMQEFDDILFDLDQRSNQVRLSMIDMIPESAEFEATQSQLNAINKEMDKVALERDIKFEPQLRAIEKATEDGTVPLKTFSQVMTAIGEKKTEIVGLENAFSSANGELIKNSNAIRAAKTEQDRLTESIAFLENAMKDASTPASEFLKGFVDGSLNGVDAFDQIISKLGEMKDPVRQNQIAVDLFGTQFENLGASSVLAIDLTKTSLEEMSGATDALNAQYDTLPQAFEGVKRQLLTAIQPIGDAILGVANEIMPLLLKAIDDMKPSIEVFAKQLGVFLVKASKEFGKFLVKTVIPALKTLWKFINKNVIPIVKALWKLFSQSKKQGSEVQKAFKKIQEVIEPFIKKTMVNLLDIWNDIKKWTDKNWPLIQKTITVVIKAIKAIIDQNVKIIQKIWDKWGDEIMAVTDFIFNTVFKIVKTQINAVLSMITTVMKIITGDWKGAWDEIKGIIDTTWKAIQSINKAATELMFNVIKSIMNEINASVSNVWNSIKTIITNKLNEINASVSNVWNSIKTITINALNEINASVSNVWSSIKTITINALNEIKTAVSTIWNDIKSIIETIANSIVTSITSIFSNSVNAIKTSLLNALSSAFTQVANSIGSLTELVTIGQNIVNSILSGFTSVTTFVSGIMTKMSDWLNAVSSTAHTMWAKAKNIGSNIIVKIKEGFASFKDDLMTKMSDWLNAVSSTAHSMWAKAKNIGSNIIVKVKEGFASFKDDLMTKMSDWLNSVSATAHSMWAKAKSIGSNIINKILEGFGGLRDNFISWIQDKLEEWLGDVFGSVGPLSLNANFSGDGAGTLGGLGGRGFQNLLGSQSFAAPATVSAPALGLTSTNNTTNVFNLGGNTISSEVDAAIFVTKVEQAITQILR